MAGGRPTKYKQEYDEQVYKLCLLGATDEEIADFFNVCVNTVGNWKKSEPGFLGALKKGKMEADAELAKTLYTRAKGYEQPEDKIFQHEGEAIIVPTIKHIPPDVTALIFWLKNRQPDKWRDKQEIKQDITLDGSLDTRLIEGRQRARERFENEKKNDE